MIRAWRYVAGAAEPETVDPDALAQAVEPDAHLWVDLVAASEDELDSIAAQLGINPLTTEDLHHGDQRTKLEHYHAHSHVAVHDCELHDTRLVTREVDLVYGDGWLVSVRQVSDDPSAPEPFDLEAVRHRFELVRGEIPDAPCAMLVWSFLDVIVDRYFVVGEKVDDRLDDVEELVFGEQSRTGISQGIFALRRGLVAFRRAAAPLREVVGQALRGEVPAVNDEARTYFQDLYDHLLRIAELVDSQRDLLTGLLEAELAVVSNRMNLVMKRMTSWGAILLGSTLIAGIYGMNFRHMPELDWKYGYAFALGTMAVLTLVLYWWFKRKDML